MTRQDDRTPKEMETHTWLVIGTDRFLSGWGGAEGGLSYAAWACRPEDGQEVFNWVRRRGDMDNVQESVDSPSEHYRPSCAHLHIYTVGENHPALA